MNDDNFRFLPPVSVPAPSAVGLPGWAADSVGSVPQLGNGHEVAGLVIRFGNSDGLQQWWDSLSPECREWVPKSLLRRACGLCDSTEDTSRNDDPEDEGWQQEVIDLCRRRDELESYAAVVRSFCPDQFPTKAMESVDETLGRLLFSLYMELYWEDDTHLAGVASCDPKAWWARPGAPGSWPRSN